MKIARKIKLSLFPAVALAMCSISLLAQEENFSSQELQELKQPQHTELLNLEDDKPLLMEVETKTTRVNAPSSSTKESSTGGSPTQASKTKTAAKEKGEEDALNFNFLYFIIQRFKISDIVDD